MLSPWEVRKIGRRADLSDFWKGQIIIAKWLGQKQHNLLSNSEYLPNTGRVGIKKSNQDICFDMVCAETSLSHGSNLK